MIIGVDMGASAVKLCALEGERILRTHYEHGRGGDVPAMLERLGLDAAEAEAIALTGLAAKSSGLERLGRPLSYISEPEAGEYTHLCGTGVGGGTLKGLSVKLLGLEDMSRLNEMAMRGRNGKVDLLIGDFVEGYGILDQEITASNLARMDPTASDEDWAAGISTLVLQVIGTMSLMACAGSGASAVVVIGAMAGSAPSRRNFAQFERVYGTQFLIPEHSACATAIGAARRARCV